MINGRCGGVLRAIANVQRSLGGRLKPLVIGLTFIVGLGGASSVIAFLQVPDEPSPESGTSQVVAQGVATIPDREMRWLVTERSAPPPANASTVTSDLGFLTVDSGVLLVEDIESGVQERLPAGEATMTLAGIEQIRAALGAEEAAFRELTLVEAGAAAPDVGRVIFSGEPFTGPGTRHDLDLVQDALAPGAQANLPTGALPTLVLILEGAAQITTEAGDVLALGPGEAVELTGPLVVTATDEGADFAAAFVGPAVPRLAQAIATPQAGVRVIETPAEEATPAAEDVAVPAEPAETPGAELDDDGDGLTNANEAELNTDPALADTDEDGLSDGEEVLEFETAPLAPDTDGDGILDGDEIAQGTNPRDGLEIAEEEPPITDEATAGEEIPAEVPPQEETTPADSDGDGLEDAIEFELGTDPADTDTDDDGSTDGDEYYVHQTGTRNPDSDGDGVVDGDEVANGTDPNDPNSF